MVSRFLEQSEPKHPALKHFPQRIYAMLKNTDDIEVHREVLLIKQDFVPSMIRVAAFELEQGHRDAADQISLDLQNTGIIDDELDTQRKILLENLIDGEVYKKYVLNLLNLQRQLMEGVREIAGMDLPIPLPPELQKAMEELGE